MKRKETNFAQTSHFSNTHFKAKRRRRKKLAAAAAAAGCVCVRWFVSHAQTRDALDRVFFVDDDDYIIIVILDDVVLRSRNNYSR